MPTISELPAATSVGPADEIPISQGGSLLSVSVGLLLETTQPAIMAPTGSLLGRVSLGAGGPEAITVGTGVALGAGTLVATGADHALFPVEASPSASDEFVVNGTAGPKLLPIASLQQFLQPSTAVANVSVAALPVASTISSGDLVAISQNGTNAAITYANLIDGETIDEAAPAAPAADTDEFWVAQGSSTMLRQTFAAIWPWIETKLASYKLPVVELTVNTTLDGTVHNGRVLVCSAPLTLTPVFGNMGSGFFCEVLNLSSGAVTFGTGITVPSGSSTLAAGQAALLRGLTYSQGNFVVAVPLSGVAATPTTAPGPISGPVSTATTSNSISVAWTAPTTGGSVASYTVQYRPTGTSAWLTQAAPGLAIGATITGLAAATSYDITVVPQNAAGAGPTSTLISVTTAAAVAGPGQVINLAVSSVTANSVTLSWTAPTTGGAVASYTVQYAVAGNSSWTVFGSGIAGTSVTVTGLQSATTYNLEVIAVNAGGSGPASATLAASTGSSGNSVTSMTWNLPPASNYAVGSGAIGVNVHVSPSTAAVQFGLSASSTTRPTTWVAATYVNTDLWGAYLATPTVSGTYYVWCEGMDGSAPTVYPTPFTVS